MRNWIVSITSRIKICFLLPQHDRWLLDHHRLLLLLHHHLYSKSSIARHRSRGARKASTWRYVLLFIIVVINLPFFSSMSKTNSFSIKTNDFSSRRTTTLLSLSFSLSLYARTSSSFHHRVRALTFVLIHHHTRSHKNNKRVIIINRRMRNLEWTLQTQSRSWSDARRWYIWIK